MDATEQESDASSAIVCLDPLVTLSARTARAPMGIAGAKASALRGRKGLHLIALSEPIEDDGRHVKIARDIQAVSAELPDSRFVVMTASEFDAYLLAPLGLAAFPASAQIFADDVVFKPIDCSVEFDAVVRPHGEHEALIDELRGILRLDAPEDAHQINRARVGLCLSSADARASTEYLLCGLPVVAAEAAAAGRYLMPPFGRIVPPDPQSIAAAIDALAAARIPKVIVRNHVLNLLRMERHNFLIAANKLAKEAFGIANLFTAMDPFTQAWRAQ